MRSARIRSEPELPETIRSETMSVKACALGLTSKERLMPNMQWIAVDAIKPNPRNARTHPKKQIRQIADSIDAFGFVSPILIDEDNVIVAGHGRWEAAVLHGLPEVPVIRVEGLSKAKRRALALADNKIGENAGWDRELLATELPELADLLVMEGLEISITAFAPVEIAINHTHIREGPTATTT